VTDAVTFKPYRAALALLQAVMRLIPPIFSIKRRPMSMSMNVCPWI